MAVFVDLQINQQCLVTTLTRVLTEFIGPDKYHENLFIIFHLFALAYIYIYMTVTHIFDVSD